MKVKFTCKGWQKYQSLGRLCKILQIGQFSILDWLLASHTFCALSLLLACSLLFASLLLSAFSFAFSLACFSLLLASLLLSAFSLAFSLALAFHFIHLLSLLNDSSADYVGLFSVCSQIAFYGDGCTITSGLMDTVDSED